MALRVTDLPPQTAKPVKLPRQRRIYTVEEWLRMPAERPYTELIDGVLHKMPSASYNHSDIIYNIRAALSPYVFAEKLGRVGGEVNVLVEGLTGKNGWIPDLAFASKDNLLKIGENWEGVPDWVLEVWAGKRKETKRIEEKRKCWQQAGVPELWEVILQAGQHIVNVYRLDEQGLYCLVPTEGDRICSIAIVGFCIERSAIFANLVGE
jgi:Uma2 family endonuclease